MHRHHHSHELERIYELEDGLDKAEKIARLLLAHLSPNPHSTRYIQTKEWLTWKEDYDKRHRP